jgi:hypothetical protein
VALLSAVVAGLGVLLLGRSLSAVRTGQGRRHGFGGGTDERGAVSPGHRAAWAPPSRRRGRRGRTAWCRPCRPSPRAR